MRKRKPLPVFEHQGEKLTYLLHTRGDWRTPSPRNSSLADGERVTRNGQDHPSPLVRSQTTLAEALAVNEARVSTWFNGHTRVPDDDLAEICRIFAVDELAFRTLPFQPFKTFVETGFIDPEWSRWRRLIAERASAGGLHLLTRDPFAETPSAHDDPMRHARIRSAGRDRSLPEIAAATPFWLAVRSPQDEDGAPVWSGWHLLALNHDERTDGFACSLSPGTDPAELGSAAFPPDTLTHCLPRRPVLEHEADDRGMFAMIVVATREPLPPTILGPRARGRA